MKFNYLNQLLLKLKSYFFRPKYYGVNVICKRYSRYIDTYLGNSKIVHCGYLFYGLKRVHVTQYPNFLVPFKINKNKKYYLLIISYTSIKNVDFKENSQHIIELFDNIENAQNAINYIKEKITPSQHDIFKMAENQDLSEKLNNENYSFSIDSKGELTLIDNKNWRSESKSESKFVIKEVEFL